MQNYHQKDKSQVWAWTHWRATWHVLFMSSFLMYGLRVAIQLLKHYLFVPSVFVYMNTISKRVTLRKMIFISLIVALCLFLFTFFVQAQFIRFRSSMRERLNLHLRFWCLFPNGLRTSYNFFIIYVNHFYFV